MTKPLMNKQEVFDTVVQHLVTQARRSATLIGGCRYRGPDGTKCAIGALIPDESYVPDIESKVAGRAEVIALLPFALSSHPAERVGYSSGYSYDEVFLNRLQVLHDVRLDNDFFDNFDRDVSSIAHDYDLVNNNPRENRPVT